MARALVCSLLALAASLAGCGGDGRPSAVAGEPISFAQLSQAASGSAEARSGRFAFSVRVEAAELEGQLSVAGEGAFDAEAGRASFEVDLSGFGAILGSLFAGLAGRGGPDLDDPDLWRIATIRDGATTYVRLPALAEQLPPGKTWLRAEDGEPLRMKGLGIESLTRLTQPDPKEPLRVLEALERLAGELEVVGEETLRGVETTRYRATVTAESVERAAAKESGHDLGGLTGQLVGQSGISEVPIEVWIDGEGLLRKLSLEAEAMRPGASAPSRAAVSFELWDLGEPVEITVPPPSEVVDASALRR
ncbi:MAG: hypothetical protein RMM28_07735 [Thermoleophilia bacterium]|nr:hypothetical protein [Gaiellaceae bacterium]MDW8339010.1 hypothetical protein [Thermoleophilia bacterium]